MSRLANTLRNGLLLATLSSALAALLVMTGCSTTPKETALPFVFNKPKPARTAPLAEVPEIKVPPEWLTIESTVLSLGEVDLLTRMQMGFALEDQDQRAIDVEENWYASHTDYLDRTFRRGELYLYYIVSELENRKMPLELALLPVVESAFNPGALSTARAAGLWQFIPATGKRFGLRQNLYYDGRRDVTESTRAALDYLQFLSNEFNGDWLLAVAAYNCGEGNVARAIERNQARGKPIDFFSLDLPRETEAYVPKLLAMRRIVQEPARYGLTFGTLKNQPYFVKVDVGGQIDLNLAAELAGMTREDFLAINPAFKRRVTDPTGPHELLIPVANEQAFLERLATLPASARVPVVYYRVRKGDTLSRISQRYGIEVAELMSMNGLKNKKVKPGQELVLRGVNNAQVAKLVEETKDIDTRANVPRSSGKTATHTVRAGDTLWSIAQRYDMDPSVLASLNNIEGSAIKAGPKLKLIGNSKTTSRAPSNDKMTYTVRRGDTLAEIAQQFRVGVKQVMSWNNLRSASAIKAGQKLVIYMDDSRAGG